MGPSTEFKHVKPSSSQGNEFNGLQWRPLGRKQGEEEYENKGKERLRIEFKGEEERCENLRTVRSDMRREN